MNHLNKSGWVVLIIFQLILLIGVVFLKPIYTIAMILGVGCFSYLLWGKHQLPKSILLAVIISSILLETRRRFFIKLEEIPLIFVVSFAFFNRLLGKKSDAKIGATGKWLMLFLCAVALSAVIGIYRGRAFWKVGGEFIIYFYYLLFFAVIESNLSSRWTKYIIYGIIGVGVVITFTYFWMSWSGRGMQRAATDQQHLLNVAIPLTFSWLLYEKKRKRKLLLGLILISMTVAVVITLTRMLWVSIPLSLIFVFLLYLRREKKPLFHYFTSTRIVMMSVILLLMWFSTKKIIMSHSIFRDIFHLRVLSLSQLSTDSSFLGRVELSSYVWGKIKKHPLVGTGLGDIVWYKGINLIGLRVFAISGPFFPILLSEPIPIIYWLDNSYLTILWKLGIIGLILFIGLYTVFMKRCWFVFKNTENEFEKWASLGIFVSFASLLAIAFLSAILVGYRFNLTWAVLMGVVELWAQRIEKRQR